MTNADKTKQQLIEELEGLRLRTAEHEKLEAERKPVEESKTKARRTVHTSITGKIALLGIGLAAFYWMLDSAMHAFVFHEGTLIEAILLQGYHGIWERLLMVCLLVMFSVYAQFIINNRKRAEAALRESNRRFSDIAESTLEWIWEVDTNGKYTYASPVVEKILGYKPEEVLKKHFYDLFLPDEREELKKAAFEVFAKMQPFREFINRNVHKNGKTVWLSTGGVPILDEKGNLLGYRGADIDITERKRAEKELEESQEKLWSMFESITDGLLVTHLNGVIIEINERAVEMHGFGSRDELLDKSAIELVAPHDHKRIATNMRRAIKQGQIRGIEYTLLKADGTEFPAELSTNVLKDASGNPVGHITLARDITERKRVEKALWESEERYRALVHLGAEVGESIIVLQDNEQGLAIQTFVNDEWPRVTGYSKEELTSMSFFDLVHPEYREASMERHRRKIAGESIPGVFELPIIRKDGTEVAVELTSAYTTFNGKRANVAYIRDITERKQAEAERKELEQKAQLASHLAAVGEMASGIAHEINNPLTAVIGFAQLVMDRNIPDDVREDIDIICSEAQRTAEVVKNLLTFARKHAPASQLTNINSVVEDTLKLRAYEHRVNNIQVNTRFDPKLPEIMVDYFQMQQVFLNIILNGETAMLEAHNKGTLTITTQKVNSTINVSFTDDGPGIAKENLSRIFDPFFTTREVGKGTGLGLSVCYGIVAEHGGRIYARSKLGTGATFVVELPINAD